MHDSVVFADVKKNKISQSPARKSKSQQDIAAIHRLKPYTELRVKRDLFHYQAVAEGPALSLLESPHSRSHRPRQVRARIGAHLPMTSRTCSLTDRWPVTVKPRSQHVKWTDLNSSSEHVHFDVSVHSARTPVRERQLSSVHVLRTSHYAPFTPPTRQD